MRLLHLVGAVAPSAWSARSRSDSSSPQTSSPSRASAADCSASTCSATPWSAPEKFVADEVVAAAGGDRGEREQDGRGATRAHGAEKGSGRK